MRSLSLLGLLACHGIGDPAGAAKPRPGEERLVWVPSLIVAGYSGGAHRGEVATRAVRASQTSRPPSAATSTRPLACGWFAPESLTQTHLSPSPKRRYLISPATRQHRTCHILTPGNGRDGIRVSIIISVDLPQEVDELADRVRAAGGRFTQEPVDADFHDGRSAYFAEDNYWESAWIASGGPVVQAAKHAAGLTQ